MAFQTRFLQSTIKKQYRIKKLPNKLKANYEMLIASTFIGKSTSKFNHHTMPKD